MHFKSFLIFLLGLPLPALLQEIYTTVEPEPDSSTLKSFSTTFSVSNVTANKFDYYSKPFRFSGRTTWENFQNLPQCAKNNCTEVLQTSNFPKDSYFSQNGFVFEVVRSYSHHHNLVLRPDDIWAAIMIQFSSYVNKHSEELREKFVDFDGKKKLSVVGREYGVLVKSMSYEIKRNLKDPEFREWVIPNFSTTTENDVVSIGVVLMATLKKYFDYKFYFICGIPSITLEGTVEDWENIHRRLEKLKEYKLEKWYDMLEPILEQFVNAKKGKPDISFWKRIVNSHGGCGGVDSISGWITAFCVFDKDGNWQKSYPTRSGFEKPWLVIDIDNIPPGVAEVDVKIEVCEGEERNAVMFAGHMAVEVKDEDYTLQPTLGWGISYKGEKYKPYCD